MLVHFPYGSGEVALDIPDEKLRGVYQFARETRWARVYLLSSLPPEKVKDYFMHPLADVEDIRPLIQEARSIAALPQATLTFAEILGGNG